MRELITQTTDTRSILGNISFKVQKHFGGLIWLTLTIYSHPEWVQRGDEQWEARWRILAERIVSLAQRVCPRLDGQLKIIL